MNILKTNKDNFGDPLNYPFLDAKGIYRVLGGVVSKTTIYNMMHKLLNERDKNGNLLIDPDRMPPTTKILIPTEIFCKKYKIERKEKDK